MAYPRYPSTGTAEFQFDFASARPPFDEFSDQSWADRPSGPHFRPSKSSSALSRSGVRNRADLASQRSQPHFEFSNPAPRHSVNSDEILQYSFNSVLSGSRPLPSSSFPGPPVEASDQRINNYLNDAHSPWAPLSETSVAQPNTARQPAHLDYRNYRSDHQSEGESIATGHCASDSGYQSHSRGFSTQSVRSAAEPLEYRQDYPADLVQRFDTLHPFVAMSGSSPGGTSDKVESHNSRSPSRSRGGKRPLACNKCPKILKCPSDFKKHMLKHDKPHKCDIPNCSRTEGFITSNDLMRHQKSVHKVGVDTVTRSFKCAYSQCKSPEKVWPRLDNFKQHIIRMHKDENVDDLIARSEIRHGTSADGDASNPSLERDLAGIDGASKYPEVLTVHPDELMRNSSLDATRSLQDQSSNVNQDPQVPFNGFTFGKAPYRQPATRKQAGSTSSGNSYTRPNSNTQSGSQGPLNFFADIALATPPTSAQNSGNTYSTGFSSALAASPEKSMQLEGQSGFQSTQLLESLKSIAKELGVASKHDRERILLALKPAAKEFRFADSDRSKRLHQQRGLQGVQGMPHNGRQASPYDSGLSDEQNGKIDSASEEEVVLKGLAFLASIGNDTPNSKESYGWREGDHLGDKPKARSSGAVKCPHNCGVVKKRQCDMNKHIKRHTKPYACVYPDCTKTFGSKSDWSRHETGQHPQGGSEGWYCQHPDKNGQFGRCGAAKHRADRFEDHLRKAHRLENESQIADHLRDWKIGPRDQPRFWCGFCREAVEQSPAGAVNVKCRFADRCSHISKHYLDGRHISDWLNWQTNKLKGASATESDCSSSSSDEEASSPAHLRTTPIPEVVVTPENAGSPKSRKRKNSDGKSTLESEWYCCQCGVGPWLADLHKTCSNYDANCPHERCQTCAYSRKRSKVHGKDSPPAIDLTSSG